MDIMKLRWNDYCAKFHTHNLFFTNTNKDIIIDISEGNGDNLSEEDIAAGYCDYWYTSIVDKTGEFGGPIVLTKSLIKNDNQTIEEIISLLKDEVITIYDSGDRKLFDDDYHLISRYEANMINHFLYDIRNGDMDAINFVEFEKEFREINKTNWDKLKEYYETADDMFVKELKDIKKEVLSIAKMQPQYLNGHLIITDVTVNKIIDKHVEEHRPKG